MIKVKGLIKKAIEKAFPLNYTCNNCGREIFTGEYFCEKCESEIPYNNGITCNHCGRRTFNSEEYCYSCSGRETYFLKARSAFIYAPPITNLIFQMKYNGKRYIAKIFAKEMANVYYRNFFNCDTVVFTPMSKERLSERGYNQAELLAQEFCEITGLSLNSTALQKIKETPRQATITSAKQRHENLQGSFKLVNKEQIKDKNLLLIDDVMTTGATVEILCKLLLKGGAKSVSVLTGASVSKGPEKELR